ncbi:MAG TPA: DHA2 family efflux MFS transporter permease subunit [Tepidisphaeraceae bacterium]|nr:DHA2 family efflux MFS transporter permease subunit [Tepidisphaeraceae bacterium]
MSAPPPSLTVSPEQALTRRLLPWLVAVALFMEQLDTTILNTAVPTMAAALHVPALSMKSALTSYLLSLAVFIPISGWIADKFGTKRVFFIAIALFTLGSLACGCSLNMPMLVASRVFQGCGGALMVPVGRIALVRAFPKSELLAAWSFVSIPALIGPFLGPLVGGIIVDYLQWRMIFFVNLPMGLLGLYLTVRHMPDFRAPRPDPLDGLGLVLFGAGIALLSYVLEVFGENTLDVSEEFFLLIVSAALLWGYWLHARREQYPLLRLRLFTIRTFRSAVSGSFITRLGIGGLPFLLPLLYQIGLGYSAVESGLLIMPQTLAAIALRPFIPWLLKKFGFRRVLLSNTVAIGGLTVLFMSIGRGTPPWVIVGEAMLFGTFSSLQYASMNTLAFADLDDSDESSGSSISSTVQQMSISFGVAIASLATVILLGDNRHPDSTQMIVGIHHTFLFLGLFTVGSAWIFRQLKPDDGQSVSGHRLR